VRDESKDVRNLGKPVDLAGRYFEEGADEVTFLNITSFRNSPLKDQPMLEVGTSRRGREACRCAYSRKNHETACAAWRLTCFSPLPPQQILRQASQRVFVPLTIGGGIRDTTDPDGTPHPALEVASEYFRSGADKVSIGSDAVLIAEEYIRTGQKTGA
jgi:glutamine amidotransferase/cyclase